MLTFNSNEMKEIVFYKVIAVIHAHCFRMSISLHERITRFREDFGNKTKASIHG